jgi:tetratricopeptide (TPR) repeat protein
MFGSDGLFAPIYQRWHNRKEDRANAPAAALSAIRDKPWNTSTAPAKIYKPKGMIGPEERRALYWLAKNWITGRGAIVDAGAYIGASAFSLAAGLSANPNIASSQPVIHSFDYFRAIDDYVIRNLQQDAGRMVEPGDDYLDVFLRQTRTYRRFIEPHPGDFLTMRWNAPIEILFIEVAKTPELNSHLLREFFPYLIPGHSVVIQQDFFHCWHPHIHITMEALEPYFEILDRRIDYTSRLYRCTKAIPPAALEEAACYSYSPEERLTMLDAIAGKEVGDLQAMIEVVTMWQLALDGNNALLERRQADLLRRHGAVRENANWWRQAQEVMEYQTRRAPQTSLMRLVSPEPASPDQLYDKLAAALESAVERLPPHMAATNRQHRFRCEHLVDAVQAWISAHSSAEPGFDALAFLEDYCRDRGGHKAVHVAAAVEYRKLNDRHNALDHISKALTLDPNDLFTQETALRLFHWADPSLPDPALVDDYLKTRFCSRPFQHFETGVEGKVWVCCPAFLPVPIGNLNDGSADAIWRSETARELRASILDGSFRYCSRMHCGDITNHRLPSNTSPEAKKLADAFVAPARSQPLPAKVVLSHDRSCNLACPTCRKDFILADKTEQAQLDKFADTVIMPLLKEAKLLYVTGSGDPFGSNHFRRLLKNIDHHSFPDLKIHLHTNGQLFNKRAWEELELSGLVQSCEVSIDAASAETYRVVRRGGDFDRLLQNLAFVRFLHRSGQIEQWTASFVVQAKNFREMPEFVRLIRQFGATTIFFQMIRNWGTFTAEEFVTEFIGNSLHPDHAEFLEVLKAPELQLPHVWLGNMANYAGGPPPED